MEELFYIICTNEEQDWWQLRYKPNHYVVSCTTGKDRILQCLYNIVVKHKSGVEVKHLMRNLYTTENKESLKKKEEEYNLVGKRYAKDVEEVVSKALHDNLIRTKGTSKLTKNKEKAQLFSGTKDLVRRKDTKEKDIDQNNTSIQEDISKKSPVLKKKIKNRIANKPKLLKK